MYIWSTMRLDMVAKEVIYDGKVEWSKDGA